MRSALKRLFDSGRIAIKRDTRSLVEGTSYSTYQCALLWLLFFTTALAVRWPAIKEAFFLNEDAALILTAKQRVVDGTLLNLFYESYGPSVIRPLQIIGLYVDFDLLMLSPQQSIILGLSIFAFAQLLCGIFTVKETGELKSLLGVLLIGVGPLSIEPTLWLSDKHDLYLFLFLSLSLLLAQRAVRMSSVLGTIALCLALVGALWSNEKAVVSPFILSTGLLLLGYPFRKVLWQVFCPTFVVVVCYFSYRLSILGTFVGGYHNSLIPEVSVLTMLERMLLVSVGAFFWQGREHSVLLLIMALSCFGLFFGGAVYLNRKRGVGWKRIAIAVCLLIFLLCISAAPTFKLSAFMKFGVQLNSRMLLLQWLSTCLIIATLLRTPGNEKMRYPFVASAIFYVGLNMILLFQNTQSYTRAFKITQNAVEAALPLCECIPQSETFVSGLPYTFQGVNTFTETVWFRAMLLLVGQREYCSPSEKPCQIRFSDCLAGECRIKEALRTEGD